MTSEPDTVLDPVAAFILDALADGRSLTPQEVARALGEARKRPRDKPDAWRRFMTPVKQQMLHLARQGRIDILRKGVPVDPEDFKGVVRMRMKSGD